MPHSTIAPLGVALALLLLTACGSPAPVPSPPTPTPARTGTPTATPTPTPTPTAEPTVSALPGCDAVFTAAQVTALMGAGMEALGDTTGSTPGAGFGSSLPDVIGIYQSVAPATHCTWILPASERGVTLSIMRVDPGTLTALSGALASLPTTAEGTATYYTLTSMEEYPATEVYLLDSSGLVISSYDGFGTNAQGIVQTARDVVTG